MPKLLALCKHSWLYLCEMSACLYQKRADVRIIFLFMVNLTRLQQCVCRSAYEAWIHTSVLKKLCYLVLRGSRDTVE